MRNAIQVMDAPWHAFSRRILIIGAGGSGKSTLARRLAERTGLPLIHLDMLYWHPGWVQTSHDEWDRVIAELTGRDRWITDGNYGRTMPQRLAACDTVIFLDLPTWLCVWRLFKRLWQYAGRRRPDLAAGCKERLSADFVLWVWQYRRRRRPEVLERLAAIGTTKQVFILRSPAEVERFAVGH